MDHRPHSAPSDRPGFSHLLSLLLMIELLCYALLRVATIWIYAIISADLLQSLVNSRCSQGLFILIIVDAEGLHRCGTEETAVHYLSSWETEKKSPLGGYTLTAK